MKAARVCIIDDDIVYQFTAKKYLEKIINVNDILIFSNGKDACEYLSEIENPEMVPDYIFLDIRMPIMDGWNFIECFRKVNSEITKDIIIYMVSSSPEPHDIERAKGIIEIQDYIVKPLTRELLEQKIA